MMRRVGLGTLLVALLPYRVAAQPSGDTAALIEQLGGSDVRLRHEAYQTLQRTRPVDAVALLGKRLPKFPLEAQGLGMYLLQSWPLDVTRAVYEKLAQDSSPFLRGATAAALWRSGDKAQSAALAAAIGASDDAMRAQLLGRLWGIDDARVRDAVRALVKPGTGPQALEDALLHLLQGRAGADAATKTAAEAVLADAGTSARARAACAAFLLAAGVTKHGPALAKELASDANAVTRLRAFLDRAPRIGPEVEDALAQKLLAARSEYEVTWPAQALHKHAAAKAVAALRELLKSKAEPVRKAALETLAQLPRALQPSELRSMLAHEDPETALVAADAMRRMDDLGGAPRVLELVAKPGAHRVAAVRALGQFRVKDAVPPLLDALADQDQRVRQEAYTGVQRLLPALFPYRQLDWSTLGYAPEAAEPERTQALAKLRAWWQAR
jgi:hypothetical protein